MEWTSEQLQAIDTRDASLLVSAAAGSGKTAVLVERIIKRITDEQNPMDVDRLLVVTFTHAAASEMRERISKALDEKLKTDPDNRHLLRQSTLVHHASITTIDSFCLSLVREWFSRLELEPDFRIGDNGECDLLCSDVLKEIMEEHYQAADPDFIALLNAYTGGKDDSQVEEYVNRIFRVSASFPYPKEERALWKSYLDGTFRPEWTEEMVREAKVLFSECAAQLKECKTICETEAEYAFLLPMFCGEYDQAMRLAECETLEGMQNAAKSLDFPTKKRTPKSFAGNQAVLDRLAADRDACKKSVKAICEQICMDTPASFAEKEAISAPAMRCLISLADELEERFSAAKREKNMVDFSDVEHLALELLVEDGKPSDIAEELKKRYCEIMIDEYQDSNRLQETILGSIAREDDRFMVGDVKQCIYCFRQARPDIFTEKYRTYGESGLTRKVILNQNYRSRAEVLHGINGLFEQIMGADFGGIAYDAEAALYPGKTFPATGDDYRPELMLIKTDTDAVAEELESQEAADELSDLPIQELEARAVAQRIHELVNDQTGLRITDGDTTRIAGYSDIVILLRTMSGWADSFVRILNECGIPAAADTRGSYFDTPEVKLVLDMLRIVDNPLQDVPLAAVLHSSVGGFSSEELARICAEAKADLAETETLSMYRSCMRYMEKGQDPSIADHLTGFFAMISDFRRQAVHLTAAELIRVILKTTGYDRLVAAMPGGEAREANLMQLCNQAEIYAGTSYSGLFHFIRYIEHLKKAELSIAEPETAGKGAAVRIMSIHHSKGLEFPVVFVCALQKSFNLQDAKKRVLIHADLGIAGDSVEPTLRVRRRTIRQKALAKRIKAQTKAEELRILYVAMTRAKEKLILSVCGKDPAAKIEKKEGEEHLLSYTRRSKANSMADWILPAASGCKERLVFRTMDMLDFLDSGTKIEEERSAALKRFTEKCGEAENDTVKQLRAAFSWVYPHADELSMYTKLSVSAIKAESYDPDADHGPLIPLPEEDTLSGAERGTFLHRVMEVVDFTGDVSSDGLKNQVEGLCEKGLLKREEADGVSLAPIEAFFRSNLAKQMTKAASDGTLHRESRFVMGIPASEIGKDYHGEELILIQGIVDAWFEQDGKIVIVDYKSDRLNAETGAQMLADHYRVQLELYKQALEKSTSKTVDACILYSFTLGQEVRL